VGGTTIDPVTAVRRAIRQRAARGPSFDAGRVGLA
jgi:hypothetical protein